MRLGWVALPLLIAVPACNPVKEYQEAARQLRFNLERVEPGLQLAFPLTRSTITFQVTLSVVNPSTVPFHLHGFEGTFRLESAGRLRPLGRVTLVRALDLPAGGTADLTMDLAFTYQDVAQLWPDLQAALHGERPGAWELEGTLHGEVHGIHVQLPVRTRHSFGAAP